MSEASEEAKMLMGNPLRKALGDLLDDLEMRASFEEDLCVACGDGVYQRACAAYGTRPQRHIGKDGPDATPLQDQIDALQTRLEASESANRSFAGRVTDLEAERDRLASPPSPTQEPSNG